MHHQCIALTSSPLLQRQQPIWHLCHTRLNTRSRQGMRMMLFCHSSAKRWLEEVKIAHANPTFLVPIGHGVMLSWHNAISQPHQVLKPYKQRVQTMNKLMVWFQRQVGLADGAVNFHEGHRKKLMLLAMAGSQWEIGWFGVNFWTQTSTKIPLESSDQGLFIGVMKIQWFYCKMILY